MKIVEEISLQSIGPFSKSGAWTKTRKALHKAIREVEWPAGSGKFSIYPESGKARGKGNGVTPIKLGLMAELELQGWVTEDSPESSSKTRPGDLDAVLTSDRGLIALEWETGNISSSHRALNKMALWLMQSKLVAGILVVPSSAFAKYLTDRIGNIRELMPYLELWKSIPVKNGVLEIAVIEHDDTSTSVPRIPKGTSGRALA